MVDKKNSEIRCAMIPLVSAILLWDATAYGQWVPAASVLELWGKAAGHGARFLTVQGAGRLFQHSD